MAMRIVVMAAVAGRRCPPRASPLDTQRCAARARAIVRTLERGFDFVPVAKARSYPPTALMTGLDRELEIALRAMGAGFHVRLISTFDPELVYAPAESDARD